MMDWTHAAAVALAAFLAALVEFVEALTIVLAVGSVSGWRPALGGTAAGLALLTVLVALLGPALGAIPLAPLQALIGILLLLFGTRWLRKAILRGAGLMALHDEAAIFSAETASLQRAIGTAIAWTTAFKAVVLEGAEVIFLVLALGAAGEALGPAVLGAASALALVVALGLMLHRPLAQVPENALKFAVGVMASSYGVFWIGEALGVAWPGGDAALIGLIAAWAGLALGLVQVLKLPKEAGA